MKTQTPRMDDIGNTIDDRDLDYYPFHSFQTFVLHFAERTQGSNVNVVNFENAKSGH
jgi:hypothetical protein